MDFPFSIAAGDEIHGSVILDCTGKLKMHKNEQLKVQKIRSLFSICNSLIVVFLFFQ